MKILVTGHNGYIGRILMKKLLENNYEVIGLDTNYFDKDCELFSENYQIKSIDKDIRNINERDLDGIEVICHLAALSNDPVGEIEPKVTYEINHSASLKLAILAKKVGVKKFLYSSSCSLYGKSDNEEFLTEDSEFNPLTAYAKSKILSEKEILPLADKNFCVTFLRNSTAYGISSKLRLDLVVNNMVGWAITTGEIRIMSDGTPWRPLIHVEDIANAFLAFIKTPENVINKKSYNIGQNSENFQIKDIAELIKKIKPNCKIIYTGEHNSDSRSYKVSFDKIKNELPYFKPNWNLEKGIENLFSEFENYKLDKKKFLGRYFIRVKQLNYLIKNKKIDNNLYWIR